MFNMHILGHFKDLVLVHKNMAILPRIWPMGLPTTHDPSANTEMVFSQAEMVARRTYAWASNFSNWAHFYMEQMGDFKFLRLN